MSLEQVAEREAIETWLSRHDVVTGIGVDTSHWLKIDLAGVVDQSSDQWLVLFKHSIIFDSAVMVEVFDNGTLKSEVIRPPYSANSFESRADRIWIKINGSDRLRRAIYIASDFFVSPAIAAITAIGYNMMKKRFAAEGAGA